MPATSNYPEVARALRKVAPEVRKTLNKELKVLAGVIVTSAKANASWSAQIPAAISTSVTNKGAGVKISGKVKIAKLYERGGKGGGAWRHPLFGNRDYWYDQSPRPFVKPAIEAHRGTAVAAAHIAVRTAIAEVGL